jgi:hypothetical protein
LARRQEAGRWPSRSWWARVCRATGILSAMLPAVDEPFLTSAPSRFVDTIEVALPADAVWAELTRDATLDWCRGLEITWLSPRPFGVGTRRQARLLGVLLQVQEEYFVWEDGRRMAFFVTAVRPAAYRRAAEDYVVEALGPDRCRFTWTLAFELTLLGKLNSPLSALIIKRMFADTRRHFERLASTA